MARHVGAAYCENCRCWVACCKQANLVLRPGGFVRIRQLLSGRLTSFFNLVGLSEFGDQYGGATVLTLDIFGFQFWICLHAGEGGFLDFFKNMNTTKSLEVVDMLTKLN